MGGNKHPVKAKRKEHTRQVSKNEVSTITATAAEKLTDNITVDKQHPVLNHSVQVTIIYYVFAEWQGNFLAIALLHAIR